ncbi:TIM-barrel domain-containing protein [Cohnella hashimotonis]|uniref:Glycoside hydrolase family 31 protein n=1 Tax=Cohnella hashimotonis TaxID=2826895 RepID=A0ABT6TNH6_9BACL|nr:TIM-barrel domain-containing protein [Cohnella hashimotonis]MDI4648091.1 glycoside hydrolase family 31 protein [Cohnella hashimotonis]
MKILRYEAQPGGLVLETSEGRMKLTPYSSRTIRIQYTMETAFGGQESIMIIRGPDPDLSYTTKEESYHLIFSTADITIRIDKQTGAFAYYDTNGSLLVQEPSRGGKTLVPIEVVKAVFDDDVKLETGQGADGLRVRADHIRREVDRKAYQTRLAFDWVDGEALYGLGSHEEGMFNLRGQHQYLYQQNMKAVVPVLVSTGGYGIVVDSYSLMKFHDDAFGSYLSTDVDAEMDYYFVSGSELDDVVQGIRHLTGKAPMLPKWAYGYVQSKERYTSQDELIETVREYRARGLPLDCIVLDWKSWTGELWGQKTLDPERFPDPTKMMDELHRINARLMVSIWPIMNPDSDNHKEMARQNGLLANQATYDAFQEKARELYWKQANEGLFVHGIDAWWCDCTEPFEADWKGAVKPEPEERMLINTAEAKLYIDPQWINAYSLLHSRGIYEGQRRTSERKRVVNLTRSAFAGQHRYGTITWSGDISANWDTLRKQIPDGLNFCATGSPYWTLDIGGFFVRNKPDQWFWSGDYDEGIDDLGYRELYVRWFQYGTFLPMFRSHGTDTPREIWRFGEPGEPFYEALASFLSLRYRLLPYIYSLAFRIYKDDYTLMRALPFDFRHDPRTYDIGDQYMFGPALLVNPVTEPMYYGSGSKPIDGRSKTRSVYLPNGSLWYDFWDGRAYEGGQVIEAEAPLARIPLYVRAGSILPIGGEIRHAEDVSSDGRLIVRIYAGQSGSFELYEDDGDSYDYEKGHYANTLLQWDEARRTFAVGERRGTHCGPITDREIVVQLFEPSVRSGSSSEPVVQSIRYTGIAAEVVF